ncbi:unnamed protein product, partial [Symbiodinium natans]
CNMVSNSPCTFTDPGINYTDLIGSVSCKTCTQSSDARCSAAGIAQAFDTGAPSSVKAVYCNDQFLVVWSSGQPPDDSTLAGVPRPPGGSGGATYDTQCVTRSTIPQSQTYKIPLSPPADESYEWTPNPPAGASGVGRNGVPFYPGLDNGGHWVWDVCEADKCNAHVGRGGDYHYHGDPIGPNCVYTLDNYTGSDPHSLTIGYALDGYTIFGRYSESGQPGIDTDLDLCGGHSHDSYGYHYHPSVETRTGSGAMVTSSYTAFYLGPKKCFKGQVSSISNYYADASKPYVQNGMDVGQPNYDNSLASTRYDPSSRNDYEDLRPCCTMSDSWAAKDIAFDTTGNTGRDGATGRDGSSTGGGTDTGDKLGSCTGTDDKGKACPPDYTADKPCPPGCTTVPNSGDDAGDDGGGGSTTASPAYTWTTSNTNAYMCDAALDTSARVLACGQAEYPAGVNEGSEATVSCASGTIECFVFASTGKVGGSCGGDPFLEDPGGEFAHMPESVGTACQGQATCTVTMGDGTLNSATTSPSTVGYSLNKFKAVAVCTEASTSSGGDDQSTSTPSATSSTTSGDDDGGQSTSSATPPANVSGASSLAMSGLWMALLLWRYES